MTRLALMCSVVAILASGCAAPSSSQGESDPPVVADLKRKVGPSLTFEDQRELGNSSLLVESEKRREELEDSRLRIAALEEEAKTRITELRKIGDEYAASSRERDELRRLLDESLGKERGLTEQAAAAEIERLRMERELIELKLAAVVRGDR